MDNTQTILTAAIGSASSLAASSAIPTNDEISTFANIIIQIAIGIATILRMLKQKKDV